MVFMLGSLRRHPSRQLFVPNLLQRIPSLLYIVSHLLLVLFVDSTFQSVEVAWKMKEKYLMSCIGGFRLGIIFSNIQKCELFIRSKVCFYVPSNPSSRHRNAWQ